MPVKFGKWFVEVGRFKCGWFPKTRKPLEWIVCRNQKDAREFQRRFLGRSRNPGVRVIWPSLRNITGAVAQKITVLPGVDLSENIEGQGRLGDLLRHRQRTFSDKAIFVDLNLWNGGKWPHFVPEWSRRGETKLVSLDGVQYWLSDSTSAESSGKLYGPNGFIGQYLSSAEAMGVAMSHRLGLASKGAGNE